MKGALVVSWTTPRVGYERQAVAYGREVDEVWGAHAAAGRCSAPEWFWGGGRNLWIVKGELDVLMGLMGETQALQAKGQIVLDGFDLELAMCGREERLAVYEKALSDIGA